MVAYQQGLAAWFAKGAPGSAPAPVIATNPAPAVIQAEQTQRMIAAHVNASAAQETLGGWLTALKARRAAARERAKNPLMANEAADAAELEVVSGGRAG